MKKDKIKKIWKKKRRKYKAGEKSLHNIEKEMECMKN